MDLLTQVIRYADREEHCGAGYTLLIRETCGALVEAKAYRKPGFSYFLRVHNPDAKPDLLPDGAEYFPESISSVTILW